MRSLKIKLGLALLALGAMSASVGFAADKNFTQEEFKTIKKDMPEEKVVEILGTPKQTVEGTHEETIVRILFWESKGKYYCVFFNDGKVDAPVAFVNKEGYDQMHLLMISFRGMF